MFAQTEFCRQNIMPYMFGKNAHGCVFKKRGVGFCKLEYNSFIIIFFCRNTFPIRPQNAPIIWIFYKRQREENIINAKRCSIAPVKIILQVECIGKSII